MAAFAAFFPWCSPQRFWDLDLNEYVALAEVMRRAHKENHGR